MSLAHDVYSETNPAYGVVLLATFIDAYTVTKKHGPDLPAAYLVLPVALSGDLAASFEGTNKRTGLRMWLQRRPEVQVGLADRINRTLNVVTEAVRFGAFSGAITVGSDGRMVLGPNKPKRSATKGLSDEPTQALKRAERLGYWFADAGSTRVVFDAMGLTV